MDYSNDVNARYLAMRVIQNQKDPATGLSYGRAITSTRTTQEAIDWWIEKLTPETPAE